MAAIDGVKIDDYRPYNNIQDYVNDMVNKVLGLINTIVVFSYADVPKELSKSNTKYEVLVKLLEAFGNISKVSVQDISLTDDMGYIIVKSPTNLRHMNGSSLLRR